MNNRMVSMDRSGLPYTFKSECHTVLRCLVSIFLLEPKAKEKKGLFKSQKVELNAESLVGSDRIIGSRLLVIAQLQPAAATSFCKISVEKIFFIQLGFASIYM